MRCCTNCRPSWPPGPAPATSAANPSTPTPEHRPNEALLVAGGLVAPLWVVLLLLPVAAVAGNLVGWWIGRKAGPAVFERPDSRLFKQRHVQRAQEFFDRNGARTIVLARFVPVVRTFATVMAGVARMDFRRFALYSRVGGVAWTTCVTLLGFWVGHVAVGPANVELFIVGVVAVSLVP